MLETVTPQKFCTWTYTSTTSICGTRETSAGSWALHVWGVHETVPGTRTFFSADLGHAHGMRNELSGPKEVASERSLFHSPFPTSVT